jgi:hypothetical protein
VRHAGRGEARRSRVEDLRRVGVPHLRHQQKSPIGEEHLDTDPGRGVVRDGRDAGAVVVVAVDHAVAVRVEEILEGRQGHGSAERRVPLLEVPADGRDVHVPVAERQRGLDRVVLEGAIGREVGRDRRQQLGQHRRHLGLGLDVNPRGTQRERRGREEHRVRVARAADVERLRGPTHALQVEDRQHLALGLALGGGEIEPVGHELQHPPLLERREHIEVHDPVAAHLGDRPERELTGRQRVRLLVEEVPRRDDLEVGRGELRRHGEGSEVLGDLREKGAAGRLHRRGELLDDDRRAGHEGALLRHALDAPRRRRTAVAVT